MSRAAARTFIIWASLLSTGIVGLFFLIAPSVGYRMEAADAMKAAGTALPPFVGYLGSAVAYAMGKHGADDTEKIANLGTLIVGPFVVFLIAFAGLIFAFSTGAHPDLFQGWLIAILSIVTLTVGAASQRLFSTESVPNED